MEELLRDPQLASQLVKLLNDNLQETRNALEVLKKTNEAYKVELDRRQDPPPRVDAAREDPGDLLLSEIRRELNAAHDEIDRLREENADLGGIIERYNASLTQNPENSLSVKSLECSGDSCPARQSATILEADVDDLRSQLDERDTQCKELKARIDELEGRLRDREAQCEMQTALVAEKDQLRTQLDEREAECEDLKTHVDVLEGKLGEKKALCHERQSALEVEQRKLRTRTAQYENSKALTQELLAANSRHQELLHAEQQRVAAELRQELEEKQVSFDQTERLLKEKLQSLTEKHEAVCKRLRIQETTPGDCSAPASTRLPGSFHSAQEQQNAQRAILAQKPHTAGASAQPQQPWYEIVNYVLSRPCFPIATPHAPKAIPSNIRTLISSNATILSCPNRIIYPTQDRAARLVAPSARCKDATQPLVLNAPYTDLAQMVGSTKEVFYHTSDGIFYAGLFLCTTTGELDAGAYAQFPKLTREAIVRHTFPSKLEHQKTEHGDLSRLRNLYLQGKAKIQYLHLQYLGFNKPFFHALLRLGLTQEPDAASSTKTLKRLLSVGEEPPAKRLREGY